MTRTYVRMRPLTAEQQRLVADHLAFANRKALEFYRQWRGRFEYEDCYQVACFGLMQAAARFDPSRGVKYTTYAAWRIRGELCHMQRRVTYSVAAICECDIDIVNEEGERLRLDGLIGPKPCQSDKTADVERLLKMVTAKQRQTLEARYGIGQPETVTKDIAAKLGRSRAAITERNRRALVAIRAAAKESA